MFMKLEHNCSNRDSSGSIILKISLLYTLSHSLHCYDKINNCNNYCVNWHFLRWILCHISDWVEVNQDIERIQPASCTTAALGILPGTGHGGEQRTLWKCGREPLLQFKKWCFSSTYHGTRVILSGENLFHMWPMDRGLGPDISTYFSGQCLLALCQVNFMQTLWISVNLLNDRQLE